MFRRVFSLTPPLSKGEGENPKPSLLGRAGWGCIATIFFILPVSVLAYVSLGSPAGFVNDFAGVLTVEQKNSLEQNLQAYQASTTNEIAVVTVNSLGDETIESYSIKLAEEWQIGTEAEDNGVLILVAVDDRQMRIEVGYGLEPYLTDLESNQIINGIMKPAFQAGDFYGGLSGAVGGIQKVLNGEQFDMPVASSKKVDYSGLINLAFFGFFIFFELIVSVLARSKSWWGGGAVGAIISAIIYFFIGLGLAIAAVTILVPLGLLIDYLVSKSYDKAKAAGRPWVFFGGGRGGSGGGGFGGFGGGSFGGGGSSGRW